MLENFRRIRILLLGHIACLFQKWQVAIRLNITLCPWIPVPVPGSTEVGGGFNDAEIRDAALFEPRACHQTAESRTNYSHIDVNIERIALILDFYVRVIIRIKCKFFGSLNILGFTITAYTLVPFLGIFRPQFFRIKIKFRKKVVQTFSLAHGDPHQIDHIMLRSRTSHVHWHCTQGP